MNQRSRGQGTCRIRVTPLLVALFAVAVGVTAGRAAEPPEAAPPPAASAASGARPGLGWLPDAPLVVAGVSLGLTGAALDAPVRPVPPGGLDRSDIQWSFDRDQVGRLDTRAGDQSDQIRNAAMAYPFVVAFFSRPSGTRFSGALRSAAVYVEASVLAGGLCAVIKNSADRPRPYTYLSSEQRAGVTGYDVTASDAFRSMPSGHASGSFCGAAFAMTDHLLSRPDAGWLERAGVPFAGGVLAGMTATLRVQAGKHFPSDVFTGALIGTSSGVAVPLAHRYFGAGGRRTPLPSRKAWLQATAGLLTGVGTGILVAEAVH